MLDMASGKKLFFSLNFRKAYYQVKVHSEDVPKTAVSTLIGLYEYTRMPFGLRNAGCTFQRILDTLFRDIPGVLIYLDDLLIASNDPEEHWQTVRRVLQICGKNQCSVWTSAISEFQKWSSWAISFQQMAFCLSLGSSWRMIGLFRNLKKSCRGC